MSRFTEMAEKRADTTMVTAVYLAFLAALVLPGINLIVLLTGVILAYVYRTSAKGWIRSHFTFQIRTFWVLLGYSIAGTLLAGFGLWQAAYEMGYVQGLGDLAPGNHDMQMWIYGAACFTGCAVLMYTLVWLIVRCAKGLSAIGRREPILHPYRWSM